MIGALVRPARRLALGGLLCGSAVLLVVCAPRPGAAAPAAGERGWTLAWRAPPGCPTAATMRARVATLLGAPVRLADELRVSGRLRADGDGWQLTLTAERRGQRTQRRLHGSDCAALGEAAAIIVALAIDPGVLATLDADAVALMRGSDREPTPRPRNTRPAVDPEPPPEPSIPEAVVPAPPEPVVEPEPVAPPVEVVTPLEVATPVEVAAVEPDEVPVAPAPVVARPRPWLAVRALGGVGLGPLPRFGGLLGVAIAVGLGRHARVELAASRWLATARRLPGSPAAGADFTLTTGAVRGCGVPGRGRIEVPLCLGAELGSMRGRGVGLEDSRSERSLWAALTAGAALVVIVAPRVALWLAVEGHVALARPRFRVDGAGELWRAGPGGLRATLGIELRFPRQGR